MEAWLAAAGAAVAATAPATALRESLLLFPLLQLVHVLGLGLLAGVIVIVDLRLLGRRLVAVPASQVLGQALPLVWAGFALVVLSGLAMFAAQAEKLVLNQFLQLKLTLLALAGLNMAWFHRRYGARVGREPPPGARASAVLSLALWAGIVAAGRLIAYAV